MNHGSLESICGSFRATLKALLLQDGAARLLIVALGILAPMLALDWWIHLPTAWRAAVLIAYLGALGSTLFWTILRPLTRKWNDREILRYLDSTTQAMLLDLFELQRGAGIQELESATGKSLAASALTNLEPLAQQVKVSQAFQRRGVNRQLCVAIGLLAIFGIGALISGQYAAIGLQRFFNPFSTRHWPSRTVITLAQPVGGWSVPQMEAFNLQATLSGVIPGEVQLVYRSASTGYYIKESVPVRSDKFAYTFPEVREPLTFYVSGGDFTTETIQLAVVERPYLKSIVAHYKYPDYAGLPDKSAAGGQISGLEGTQVRLVFECSLPVQHALFALGKTAPEEMITAKNPQGATKFEKTLMLREDGAYSIELHDNHGFREARPERYEIRVIPDNLPEVELLAPGRDVVATRNFSFEVSLKARDDFGLKRVELLYQVNGAPAVSLSDRVTGPLKQTGRESLARFTWDLRKMDELPDSAGISYFVRVQDINPTGRGVAESARRQIKLVKPSDFHLEAVESAKALLGEALIAWRNQLEAWKAGGQWLKNGTGNEDDAAWREMNDRQENSIRAAKSMAAHLAVLTEAYSNNHMEREFMAARLNSIAELLQRLVEKEHSEIAGHLRQARPRSDADGTPERLKPLRTAALQPAAANQKLAVLILERLLRKLYDWRDLQTATITSTLLHERQDEVGAMTEKISPKYIGKEFEDLSDPEQEQLLTLGKQQRAIFDTETQLETQLAHQMYKAEKQNRKSVFAPLKAAFEGLRTNRVNDNLKEAALKIENNQPSVIIKNQKAALRTLDAVKSGLVLAGQKLEPEEPLNANLEVSDAAKFEEIEVAKEEKKDEAPGETVSAEAITAQQLENVLPEGGDKLSLALRAALERQDDVLARTRYLSEKNPQQEMPRFMRLKLGVLSERQALAAQMLARAAEAAQSGSASIKEGVAVAREEFAQSAALLGAKDASAHTQHLQDDALSTIKDLLQQIAFEKAIEDSVAENKRRSGLDAFNRKFLLRDMDLDVVKAFLGVLSHARLQQKDVGRKVARFLKFPEPKAPGAGLEKANRARAGTAQKNVTVLTEAVRKQVMRLSPEAAVRFNDAGFAAITALELPSAEEINSGTSDKDLAVVTAEAAKTFGTALQSLRDLLEERVQAPVAAAQKDEEAPKKITAEEYAKATSREALVERIKLDATLPPEIREKMIEALSKDFPAKFKQLLTAYYASFGSDATKEKKP